MKKALSIAYKDLIIMLNDRVGLVFMLLAPFLLTLGMGAVTGAFNTSSGSSSGMSGVPVIIVNQDDGELGQILVDVFAGEDELFALTESPDPASSRLKVDDDVATAVVIIPAGFSKSFGDDASEAPIEIYTNPNRPISSSVVRSVISSVLSQMEIGPVSVQVSMQQLATSGLISPQDIPTAASEMASRLAEADQQGYITVKTDTQQQQTNDFNYMAYLAPAMAIFFLMYTVTQGARSILAERAEGTLPRMLVSPTSMAAILSGKLLGIFLIGFLQVGVLVLISGSLFGLQWGDPLAVLLVIAATVLACTGWGILIAAFAKEPWQVSTYGSAIMLLFGLLGGSFLPITNFNDIMRFASKITPHAWANDSFLILGQGGTLVNVLPNIAGLLIMTAALFAIAVIASRQRMAYGK